MKKILVIEDEQSVRDILIDVLSAEDFDAVGAENGRVGVDLAKQQMPNLIICDIMMPELDGRDVLVELRKDPKTTTIPFIFLTAKADKIDMRQGMELGADDYLTKPFTRSELLQAIQTRLEKQEAIAQEAQKKLNELRSNITLALPQELHKPLNEIIGISDIFMREYDSLRPLEILEMAEDINQLGKGLYRLTQNFLILANLEVVGTEPDRVKALQNQRFASPHKLIRDAVAQKAQQANRERDIQFNVEDATVRISELKLKKIVEELIDNALKFSEAGTTVSVTSSQQENKYILSVSDRGRGMTADQIAKIGAYMQFDRRVYEQQGSGLGLAIAKRLTELHQGELTLESIQGKQTTAHLVLPCE